MLEVEQIIGPIPPRSFGIARPAGLAAIIYGNRAMPTATVTISENQLARSFDRYMRKKLISATVENQLLEEKWLDLENLATIELTSEDPDFPIEAALVGDNDRNPGWRAAEPGEQTIRIVFDSPQRIRRVRLEFSETNIERTQEFTLFWVHRNGRLREIVRQQWNFSPQGATKQVEDYRADLSDVSVLELTLKPDLANPTTFAALTSWRVA